jgi:hypothetical protein
MKEITKKDPALLFIGKNDDEKVLCDNCEEIISSLMEPPSYEELKRSVNYLYACQKQITDEEVKQYVNEAIENNVEEADRRAINNNPVDPVWGNENYYKTAEPYRMSRSGWVSFMEVFVWIEIFIGIIGSIVLGSQIGGRNNGLGFIIVLAGILVTFISASLIMVFLGMAKDIREIKNNIHNITKRV